MYPQAAGPSWSDVAYSYVETFVATGFPILCLALSHVADLRPGSRWAKYQEHFKNSLADRFVNVVIGVNPTPQIALRYIKNMRADEVAYEPELTRLFTVGVPNLAVVGAWPRALDEIEKKSLGRYARIITPTENDAAVLATQGVAAHFIPPTPGSVWSLTEALKGLLA
jgi:hypothetical protein